MDIITVTKQQAALENLKLLFTIPVITHGRDCKKVEHVGDGYLHGKDDNGSYNIDGVEYCGRCHHCLDKRS